MAVSITISVDQNSQNIPNNTSNVTVTVRASWTGGSYNLLNKSGYLVIDGTKYTFTSPFNTGRTTSGTQTLFSKTVNVTHNSNGTKTLYCSASYTSGVSSGTVGASASVNLTTIARLSTLTVSNGYLGDSIQLIVTRQSTDMRHTIEFTCGSAKGTICDRSNATTVTWTPPISLAKQNTAGTTVSVRFTIATYYNNSLVGTTLKTGTYVIPSDVKPSCSIAVSDPTGHLNTYGGYVQGVSKFKVVVTPTLAYDSPISSYKTTANGETHTSSSFTTDVLGSSGSLPVSATVVDQRGRKGSATQTISVLAYKSPYIGELYIRRCDQNGTENMQGDHIMIRFSSTTTSLNNKNSATYSLRYKKTSETEDKYVTIPTTEYNDVYEISNATYIVAASIDSSYDVALTVSDNFFTDSKLAKVSTGFTLMHWLKTGLGMAIGKVAELTGVLDIGFKTKFSGGIQNEVLEKIADLNDVMTPNTYVSINKGAASYANCPIAYGTFVLECMSAGAEGQLFQRLTTTFKGTHERYERHYYQGSWGDWVCANGGDTGWMDLTLKSGISVGGEHGFLRARLKNGVLYIKGDVIGVTTNWQQIASLPSSLSGKVKSVTRFPGVYNMSYFCGMGLMTTGALHVTQNGAGSWSNTNPVSVNVAIHL